MTQEELDALMAGGVEEDISQEEETQVTDMEENLSLDDELSLEDVEKNDEELSEVDVNIKNEDIDTEDKPIDEELVDDVMQDTVEDIRVDPSSPVPPPADNEHKVVEQLDDVTRESEIKANEVFDKLDELSLVATNIKNSTTEQIDIIKSNIDIFERLSAKFSQIESFSTALDDNQKVLRRLQEVSLESENISNIVMDTMDIMQYQDIHRQKIERVINVMRALSHYMHSLFDSSVSDEQRTSAAITIDSSNSVSEDELEALLESFAKK